mmetsp:Transcript_20628/g.51598  ORF Transcript_20628/g.51598 Transcript_20628/m.51598 type:complete len:322 (-) Transcript_20628:3640-4605(-)
MKVFTKFLPMASLFEKPVISAVFLFHSETLPFLSMPKMGALAVSIRRVKSSATCLASPMTLSNSVMSCPTPTTPMTAPFESRLGVAFNKTVYRLPCLEIKGNSKFAVSSPDKALRSTSWTDLRSSGWMKFCTKFFPMVSSLVYPSMSAAFLFHSVTRPFKSTPNIGAFALSIKRDKSSAMRICSLVLSRICVMSCPTPMTPVTSPSGPRRVVAFSKMSLRSPLLLNNGNSKLAVSWPFNACCKTSFTESLNSSVMKFLTRFLPMVSLLVNSNTLDAFAFHSVTLKLVSIPKMGALAVSMSLIKSSATRLDSAITWFNSVIS